MLHCSDQPGSPGQDRPLILLTSAIGLLITAVEFFGVLQFLISVAQFSPVDVQLESFGHFV